MSFNKTAIVIQNLSKCYQIYDKPQDRLRQTILPRLQRLARLPPKHYYNEFWALKDVSFTVAHGETVGIVGRNGCGKSTLLQIIAGTLTPTSGDIEVNGRVAALLELGSGFNFEFTGRENVFFNAQILGIGREEIEDRFDRIVAFADIGPFIDQPVKTYSSGMMVRLAFAVAISVDPDILIIDEALAVGDEAFQRKCFARISGLKEKGTTILLVSHAGGTVVELCDRAILLDRGELLLCGQPKAVVSRYQKLIYASPEAAQQLREEYRQLGSVGLCLAPEPPAGNPHIVATGSEAPAEAPKAMYDPYLRPAQAVEYEKHGVEIIEPHLETLKGEQVNLLLHGEEYIYSYRVRFDRTATRVQLGMLIKTVSGLELGGGVFPSTNRQLDVMMAGSEIVVRFRFRCLLNPGTFFLNAGIVGEVDGHFTFLDRRVDAVIFKVQPILSPVANGFVDFAIVSEIDYVEHGKIGQPTSKSIQQASANN